VDLAAVAYTLQIGRDAIEERLGFVVNSLDKLSEKLGAYINGEKNIEDCYQGHVESGDKALKIIGRDTDMQEVINKWIAHNNFSKLLDLWVRGLNFDWNILYGDVKPQRISLPTYPFAQERYWIPETALHRNGDAPFEEDVDIASIEDIINKLDDDMIETDQAVKQLKMLV
jgi:polyketide synthase PksN